MKNLETLDFVANNKGWYDGDSNYAIPLMSSKLLNH